MISRTAYETATGKILYSVAGGEAGLAFPEIEGVSYADGVGDPETQEVVGGQVVSKPPEVLEQQEIDSAWLALRKERDRRLYASDWTQVPDAPVDKAAWATYRQALRNLPGNTQDPRSVVWPIAPS